MRAIRRWTMAAAALAVLIAAGQAAAASGPTAARHEALRTLHRLERRLDLAVQAYDRAEVARRAADRHAVAAARALARSGGDVTPARLAARAAALEAAQAQSWAAVGRAMGLRLRIRGLVARERHVLASLPRPRRLAFLARSKDARRAARRALHDLVASGALRGHTRGVRAARAALRAVGVPYVWGGETPAGFDCSGLVQWAYGQEGVALPRVAADQMRAGRPVRRSRLRPGDLVFFERGIGHVAMYLGDGLIVEAPHPGAVVWVTRLGDPWHAAQYQGAARP